MNFVHPMLTKTAKKYILSNFKEIKNSFKKANISLNGEGKNIIFLSGHPNLFKEEIIENNKNYIVYKSGQDKYVIEYYTFNKKLHRKNGPAYMKIFDNKILEYAYFKNGKLHNSGEPAIMHIVHFNNKEEKYYSYWYKDNFLTKEKFNIIQRKKKIQNICQKYM